MGDLSEAIQNNYVLALEVTNGLKRGNFGYKVDEALRSQRYLQVIAPEATIASGVIFTRNEHAVTNRKTELDFLLQLKDFKQDKGLQALALALVRPKQYNPEQNAQVIKYFIEQIKRGKQIEELFYPDERQLTRMAEDAPFELPKDIQSYTALISNVKGDMLEEYIGLVLRQMLPDTQIISGHEFKRKGKVQDIDHLIIGDPARIRATLANNHTFYAHNTQPKDKERYSRRNYSAMFR